MVMSDRPEVHTASWPIAAVDVATLASSFVGAISRLPVSRPVAWAQNPPRNLAVSTTRELVRTLLGYASSLPIDEFRSLERVLDGIAGRVLPPFVALQGVSSEPDQIGGVPGVWFRPARRRRGPGRRGPTRRRCSRDGRAPSSTCTEVGYIGTSPRMYSLFMAHLARVSGCEVFAADYRLAPEFPFPAAVDDVISVIVELKRGGLTSERLLIAGDSGGGGLLGTVLLRMHDVGLGRPAGALLFSPEVSLTLSEDSITANAPLDVLPWNIPVNSYLHGVDPDDERVDVLLDDIAGWPPTFLVYGADEMFRDAIRELANKLRAAGVPHVASEVEGMFHVFPFLLPWARESQDVYDRAGSFVREVLVTKRERTESARPAGTCHARQRIPTPLGRRGRYSRHARQDPDSADHRRRPRLACRRRALRHHERASTVGHVMLVEPLELTTPVSAFNGGIIVEPDLTVIEQRLVPESLVKPILTLLESHGLDTWIYRGAEWYVRDPKGPHVDREAATVQFQPTVVETFDDLWDQVAKIVGVSDDHDAMAKATEAAREQFCHDVTAAQSQPYYLDVTHPAANKGEVVKFLSSRTASPRPRSPRSGTCRTTF